MVSANSAPLDVGPTLARALWARRRTVIATSATLSAGGSMRYTAGRLGLPEADAMQLGSPFDHQRSTLLATVAGLPAPTEPGFDAAAGGALVRLIEAAEGRALALFTSHGALRASAERARGPLARSGIRLLVQGIDGTPRQLAEMLRSDARVAVFGTSSFWEGVDVRGRALSLVAIVRLPFAVPTDPVQRARAEQYDDPFREFSLPHAILRFRQGFGRLIRDRTDRGVVVVLDRRISDRSYGSEFLQGLPRCARAHGSVESVARRVAEWLAT
jgi:DNA polymerase-3 subunit epsilon/ATP-dependent DNA helicase DinG